LLHPDVYRYGEYSDGQSTILRAINDGGGAYADTNAGDAKLWAAMELYLSESAAGVADNDVAKGYLKRAAETKGVVGANMLAFAEFPYAQGFSWKHTKNLGLLSLLANGRDAEIVAKTASATGASSLTQPSKGLMKMATKYVDLINGSAFGVPHDTTEVFNWASNADIANQAGLLLQAYKYSTDSSLKPGYLAAARRTMSYLLGNNPVGKSYVTGYGTNPVRNPHHRFWAKHKDITFPPAPPGMLVGGPNAKWQGTLAGAEYLGGSWTLKNNRDAEMYMRDIMPNCMPAGAMGPSCYQDKVGLYMTNEVAINWNAALFWAVSFLK
jgi:endoglucanase